MARIGRLAGALLVEDEARYWLVGELKEPCDFAAEGFAAPGEIDALTRPVVRLSPQCQVTLKPPWLIVRGEGERLAQTVAARFLIARNGSVSERLWRLVMPPSGGQEIDAHWLGEVPDSVWQIVRDTVLRCS